MSAPSWYPSKAETGKVVPTWNYQAVHATGTLEITEDPKELLAIVTTLTKRYESGRAKPWAVSDAPADYIAAQLKGIVGFVLHVTKLEGKVKLSQNKSMADRTGVIDGCGAGEPGTRRSDAQNALAYPPLERRQIIRRLEFYDP